MTPVQHTSACDPSGTNFDAGLAARSYPLRAQAFAALEQVEQELTKLRDEQGYPIPAQELIGIIATAKSEGVLNQCTPVAYRGEGRSRAEFGSMTCEWKGGWEVAATPIALAVSIENLASGDCAIALDVRLGSPLNLLGLEDCEVRIRLNVSAKDERAYMTVRSASNDIEYDDRVLQTESVYTFAAGAGAIDLKNRPVAVVMRS